MSRFKRKFDFIIDVLITGALTGAVLGVGLLLKILLKYHWGLGLLASLLVASLAAAYINKEF